MNKYILKNVLGQCSNATCDVPNRNIHSRSIIEINHTKKLNSNTIDNMNQNVVALLIRNQ